jgi:ABC-2 type transport system permease protein
MIAVLVCKLLRDLRIGLFVVAFLLGAFQCLWARITERIIGQLAPFFNTLAGLGGLTDKDVQALVFEGPGKIIRTLIGGDAINLNGAMDMMSIGYVHPLMQTIFCIWAVGRASGAIAGETDRGTAELLLAQPMPRSHLIYAHFIVDAITIPVLCLSLWAGTAIGVWQTGPIQMRQPELKTAGPQSIYEVTLGPIKLFEIKVKPAGVAEMPIRETPKETRSRLEIRTGDFGVALPAVGGLIFAISGYTMWLSALGRFRWRVLGLAVLITLVMFLVNTIGQMWDVMAPLRPLTIFYYYQPQTMILGGSWCVTLSEWNGGKPLVQLPALLVLYGVGAIGYLMALRTLNRRDIPAPL